MGCTMRFLINNTKGSAALITLALSVGLALSGCTTGTSEAPSAGISIGQRDLPRKRRKWLWMRSRRRCAIRVGAIPLGNFSSSGHRGLGQLLRNGRRSEPPCRV